MLDRSQNLNEFVDSETFERLTDWPDQTGLPGAFELFDASMYNSSVRQFKSLSSDHSATGRFPTEGRDQTKCFQRPS